MRPTPKIEPPVGHSPPLQLRRPLNLKPAKVEDDGEGNWLVSYADMMTLMFGFFVMIAAFSKPDFEKIEKLKESTSTSMGGKYTKPFKDLSQELQAILKQKSLESDVDVQTDATGIAVISKGTLFFDTGSARLKDGALTLLQQIATLLKQRAKKEDFQISVEGHTDDRPIISQQYPSNWELSSSRASTVVRLFESAGFPHNVLRPVGLADTEPLLPNRDDKGNAIPENQSKNRRIVIRIHNFSKPTAEVSPEQLKEK